MFLKAKHSPDTGAQITELAWAQTARATYPGVVPPRLDTKQVDSWWRTAMMDDSVVGAAARACCCVLLSELVALRSACRMQMH